MSLGEGLQLAAFVGIALYWLVKMWIEHDSKDL